MERNRGARGHRPARRRVAHECPRDRDVPALRSAKQERFCEILVRGGYGSLADAYVRAGYKATSRERARKDAWSLKNSPKVAARISELQQAVRESGITGDRLARELLALIERAKAEDDLSAAVAAIREIAILAGLRDARPRQARQRRAPADVDHAALARALATVLTTPLPGPVGEHEPSSGSPGP